MGRFGPVTKPHNTGWLQSIKKAVFDHYEVLHDETQEMSSIFTSLLLFVCCLFQIFFINRPDVNTLDIIATTDASRSVVAALMFLFSILVAALTVYYTVKGRLQPKSVYSRRSRTFSTSSGFTLYKYLYRLHFYLTEPLSSGFTLSLFISPSETCKFKQFLPSLVKYLLLLPSAIGAMQSIAYILLVESILPSDNVLSASSRTNTAMINLSLRIGIATDSLTVFTNQRKISTGIKLLVALVRSNPSFIAVYSNLLNTFFFHPYGKVINTAVHIIYGTASLTYLIVPSHNNANTLLVPAYLITLLLLSSILLKIIVNLDQVQKHKPVGSETSTLATILQIAHTYQQAVVTEDQQVEQNTRLFTQLTAFLDTKDAGFERFSNRYGLRTQDPDTALISFVMYLFERLRQRSPSSSFMITLYQAYYLLHLNMSLLFLSILLGRLEALRLTFSQRLLVRRLKRLAERQFEEIYLERTSINRREVHFYREDIKDVAQFSRAGRWDRKSSRFDIFWSISLINYFSKMAETMEEAVSICQNMYDRLSTSTIHVTEIHRYTKRIYEKKISIYSMYKHQDSHIGTDEKRPILHTLLFALFVLIMDNDRPRMFKLFKAHTERMKMLERSFGGVLSHVLLEQSVKCGEDGLHDSELHEGRAGYDCTCHQKLPRCLRYYVHPD
jgi:hypothetical protein